MKALLPLCVLLAFLCGRSPAADRPNLPVILADDLRWADLGCYGNTFNETPNIDRLAREGMRFTQFYAGPVCSPTRANLQSGQDQARFGITQHIPGHKRPFAKLRDPEVPRRCRRANATTARASPWVKADLAWAVSSVETRKPPAESGPAAPKGGGGKKPGLNE